MRSIEVRMSHGTLGLIVVAVLFPAFANAMGSRLPQPAPPAEPPIESPEKPTAGDSGSSARAKCQALSDRARQRGVDTLIIVFEGLASYDSRGTQSAYAYREKLLSGERAASPERGGAGYMLHGLMVPLIAEKAASFDFLVFPHDSVGARGGSVAQICATVWKTDPDSRSRHRRLVVAGHSYGGHAANQLTDSLDAAGVDVDFVLTVDPRLRLYVGRFQRSGNVRRWENYYQLNTPFLNGYRVGGADVNENLSSRGGTHVGLPWMPPVQASLRRALE